MDLISKKNNIIDIALVKEKDIHAIYMSFSLW